MFDAYYAAMLSLWSTVVGYARIGQLTDGSPMPIGLRTEILARAPIVLALVRQGRALSATDISGNIRVMTGLSQQYIAFERLARRFGMFSLLSSVAHPIQTIRTALDNMREEDPELADFLNRIKPNVPTPFTVGAGLGAAVTAALFIGGFVALKYLTK